MSSERKATCRACGRMTYLNDKYGICHACEYPTDPVMRAWVENKLNIKLPHKEKEHVPAPADTA